MLTLKEKLEALARGEKLGSTEWDSDMYVYIKDNEFFHSHRAGIDLCHLESTTHIYQPETLKLTEEHVGKRVRLRNDDIVLILGHDHEGVWFVCFNLIAFVRHDGSHRADKIFDIIEVLD